MSNSRIRWRASMEDQSGLSLIEILGAVTIISIISITMMGYFIAGLNKSADESRRIIAANLARLKAAEIREILKTSTGYKRFAQALAPGVNTFKKDTELPDDYRNLQLLEMDNINGSIYRFIVSIRKDSGVRSSQMAGLMNSSSPSDYLLDMSITVYWDNRTDSMPLPTKSTTIDTYLVRSR
jgi:type II secretory pathway pseudopilin PulG